MPEETVADDMALYTRRDAARPALRGISLFTGIGGLELGIKMALGGRYQSVCYVEHEAFNAAVLVERMQEGLLCRSPIWSDAATFDGRPWRGKVDIVSGGPPCQAASVAGRRKGTSDARWMWPHALRIVDEVRPAIAFFENVPGLMSMGLRSVCADLRKMDYNVSAGIFSAAEVGALHVRKRIFIMAYAMRAGLADDWSVGHNTALAVSKLPSNVPNPHGIDALGQPRQQAQGKSGNGQTDADWHGKERQVADAHHQGQPQPQGQQPRQRRRFGDGSAKLPDIFLADTDRWQRRTERAHHSTLGGNVDGLHAERQEDDGGAAVSGEEVAYADIQRCGEGRAQSKIQQRRAGAGGDGADPRPAAGNDVGRQGVLVSGLDGDADGPAKGVDPYPWRDGWEDGTPRVSGPEPHRAARLRALGNAVVPQCAAEAFVQLSKNFAWSI